LAAWLAGLTVSELHAERFGVINVVPQSTVIGSTRRGYLEHRLVVANESTRRSHEVTVVYPDPDTHFPAGGLLGVSRSLVLAPGNTMTLRFWQPPMPVWANQYGIFIDGRREGSITLPRTSNHAHNPVVHSPEGYFRTYLIGRGLNSDDLRDALTQVNGRPFSAAKATGPPNAHASGLAETWVPPFTHPAHRLGAEKLTLDFSPTTGATQLVVICVNTAEFVTKVDLLNSADQTLAVLTNLTKRPGTRRLELSIPSEVSGPITRVVVTVEQPARASRVQFGIDAVELVSPVRNWFATSAKASAEFTAGVTPPGAGAPGTLPPTAFAPGTYGMPPGMASRYGLSPGGGGGLTSFEIVRSEMEPPLWSDQWLSYTPYDCILLGAQEYAAMPEAVRGALWRYAECGGVLAFLGSVSVPPPWNAAAESKASGITQASVGFGQAVLLDAPHAKALSAEQAQVLLQTAASAAQPWSGLNDVDLDGIHSLFPLLNDARLPIRNLVLLLIAFVVMVGPVNVILLSRMKRRLWLLWTIPAISLVTCLIVFAWSLTREGIVPLTRLEGLTVLDQQNHRATSLGLAAYYFPFTPGDGLRFSHDTELTLLGMGGGLGGGGTSLAPRLDWTQDQHLRDGWLAPRLPSFFRVRRTETRRERLQLEHDAQGGVMVLNGLGTAVESLRLKDHRGAHYAATNLAAGAKAVLHRVSEPAATGLGRGLLPYLYRMGAWAPADHPWRVFATNALPAGTYVARVTGAPFFEAGYPGRTRAQQDQVVVGFLEPEGTQP
jgi:hypothetical protein